MTQQPPDPADAYEPPPAFEIARVQDTLMALRLLIAQRRLYSKAKRWAFLRTVGISVIAVGAPILTAVNPETSVVVGAAAALWVFLARTVFVTRERSHSSRAAEVQEQFDIEVFGMPQIAIRHPRVTPEEISDLVGTDEMAQQTARKERLLGWYPIDEELSGAQCIAIAQRANAAYSERLQRANANVWLSITAGWSVVALCVGLALDLTVAQFLLGVAIPLLPALLDVYEQCRAIRAAGSERRALADGIERLLREDDGHPIAGQDLLVWQDQLYALRRKAPQVPDLVYKRARKKNELAMHAAASALAAAAKAISAASHGETESP